MTRYLSFLLAVLFSFTSFAQIEDLDILKPESFADSCAMRLEPNVGYIPNLVLFINPDGGYVCGNSIYGIKSKAQKYYLNQPATMTHVGFLFGEKTQGNNPGAIRAKVYSVGQDGKPDSVLATSQMLSVDSLKASRVNVDSISKITALPLPDTLEVSDSFFVALDLTLLNAGDSVGLLSTEDKCYTGQLAWEEAQNGTWYPFNDTVLSWGLDIDMAIYPIGDFGLPSALRNRAKNQPELKLYPNPASTWVYFEYPTALTSPVSIHVYDLQGQLVKKIENQEEPDQMTRRLDVNDLNTGVYLCTVTSENFSYTKKLIISR